MSHWSEYDYVIVNRDLADKSPRPRRSSPPSGCAAPAKSASPISSTACGQGDNHPAAAAFGVPGGGFR